MPTRPEKPCQHPTCPKLTRGRYCATHRRVYARPDRRAPAPKRGYDAAWKRVRAAYAAANPVCEDPEGRHGEYPPPVAIVDHVTPISEGGARLDPSNLQSLCRSCHGRKTARETR